MTDELALSHYSRQWLGQVNCLVRLMMIANRRAIWHRYQRGRQQRHDGRELRPHRSAKRAPLKPTHRYHQALLTDAQLMTLYKFTACALYQANEWTGGPEQAPRLVKLMQQLQSTLGQDVLTHLSLWGKAPWGSVT